MYATTISLLMLYCIRKNKFRNVWRLFPRTSVANGALRYFLFACLAQTKGPYYISYKNKRVHERLYKMHHRVCVNWYMQRCSQGGAEGAQAPPLSNQNIDVYFLSYSPTL